MNKKIVTVFLLLVITVVLICLGTLFKDKQMNSPFLPFEVEAGKYIAVMYIGGSEDSYNYSLVQKYYENNEFDTIDIGGEEKYLIIPLGKPISVFSLSLTEDGGVEEKLIRKSVIAPFYIKCNMSDIFSNCLLRVMVNNKQYSYSPYISLKDGSVVVEDFVYNVNK